MRYCLTHILFMGFSLPFMCVGCLGDFKSNSASSTNYQITGRASAGPIKDATVTVYLLNSAGAHARVLATGTTDSKGNFSLQYEPSKITLSQTVIEVGITGGNFTEEATGATTSFGLYQMRSRLTVATDAIVSAVTPLTEIATARADALMAGGLDVASAADQANAEVAVAAGVDNIITTLPDNPEGSIADPFAESALYATVLAGVSKFGTDLGADSLIATAAFSKDFKDGVLNGTDNISAVVIADALSTPLAADAWSNGVGAAINSFVASTNNTSGLGANGAVPQLVNVPHLSKAKFIYTGSDQSWIVPANVTSVTVKAWGAGGGGGAYLTTSSGAGGGGAYVEMELAVTPGETLTIITGGGGELNALNVPGSGAYGGGGAAGLMRSGGGGGRSAVRRAATELVTAGAGGGADGTANIAGSGGAGGATGHDGLAGFQYTIANPAAYVGYAGAGGTPSAGGAGGSGIVSGNPGAQFSGGNVGNVWGLAQGGGGGGYYGGGAGASDNQYIAGGGGGGSCFTSVAGTIHDGVGRAPGGLTNIDYIFHVGYGGLPQHSGSPGLVVIRYTP